MQLYPAIRARMGRWEYYIVRMSMRELDKNVRFASEIHETNLLSKAIQRQLNESRAKKQITTYLAKQEDRFFASIVVAVLGGEPHWHPVVMESKEFSIIASDNKLANSFGVLTFNDEEQYYALDGQHRLAAIRELVQNPTSNDAPEGFWNEEMSVILVTPTQLEGYDDFLIRYRRLFGHLNRYAKPMSQFDNIVMDEDDTIAIVTRRLVSRHSFFSSAGDEFESSRIMMKKGKNIPAGSSHWTSLENLYDLNAALLNTRKRRNEGWGRIHDKLSEYKRFRPDDDEIDELAEELFARWEAITDALPVLWEDPSRMRVHNPDDSEEHGKDNILFWPIGQQLLVDLAQQLLDEALSRTPDETETLSADEAREALTPLNRIVWDAHRPPWRHLLLVSSGDDRGWRIASEDRKPRIRIAERIIRWQVGLDRNLSDEQLTGPEGLRSAWRALLPVDASDEVDWMWDEIMSGVLD